MTIKNDSDGWLKHFALYYNVYTNNKTVLIKFEKLKPLKKNIID